MDLRPVHRLKIMPSGAPTWVPIGGIEPQRLAIIEIDLVVRDQVVRSATQAVTGHHQAGGVARGLGNCSA
jgi:hypothetical protein